jgi:hypothetical protein
MSRGIGNKMKRNELETSKCSSKCSSKMRFCLIQKRDKKASSTPTLDWCKTHCLLTTDLDDWSFHEILVV